MAAPFGGSWCGLSATQPPSCFLSAHALCSGEAKVPVDLGCRPSLCREALCMHGWGGGRAPSAQEAARPECPISSPCLADTAAFNCSVSADWQEGGIFFSDVGSKLRSSRRSGCCNGSPRLATHMVIVHSFKSCLNLRCFAGCY